MSNDMKWSDPLSPVAASCDITPVQLIPFPVTVSTVSDQSRRFGGIGQLRLNFLFLPVGEKMARKTIDCKETSHTLR